MSLQPLPGAVLDWQQIFCFRDYGGGKKGFDGFPGRAIPVPRKHKECGVQDRPKQVELFMTTSFLNDFFPIEGSRREQVDTNLIVGGAVLDLCQRLEPDGRSPAEDQIAYTVIHASIFETWNEFDPFFATGSITFMKDILGPSAIQVIFGGAMDYTGGNYRVELGNECDFEIPTKPSQIFPILRGENGWDDGFLLQIYGPYFYGLFCQGECNYDDIDPDIARYREAYYGGPDCCKEKESDAGKKGRDSFPFPFFELGAIP